MWAGIATRLGGMFLTYVVMPLFSKLLVMIEEWFVEKRKDEEVKAIIKDKLEAYKNAKTPEDQEAAFIELHRARKL